MRDRAQNCAKSWHAPDKVKEMNSEEESVDSVAKDTEHQVEQVVQEALQSKHTQRHTHIRTYPWTHTHTDEFHENINQYTSQIDFKEITPN